MNLTEIQYERLLARLAAIEERLNSVAIAMDKFIALDQIAELMVLVQTDIDDLRATTLSLEERVVAIEEEPLEN